MQQTANEPAPDKKDRQLTCGITRGEVHINKDQKDDLLQEECVQCNCIDRGECNQPLHSLCHRVNDQHHQFSESRHVKDVAGFLLFKFQAHCKQQNLKKKDK